MLVADAGAVKYLLPKLVIGGTDQTVPPALRQAGDNWPVIAPARQLALQVIGIGA
ncbi:hypothetical protein [Vogesella sp. AC12]|uniref:hypothetical protein n=1 Tax=Vogesella sp. AC12 TaxID=2950550 RepID=UPI00210B2ED7|nr:hypothetical protein [Vogesella sp. AC12]MCQ4145272.1 hypothetical protein [Vogesella sp. AC12]